MVRIRPGDRKDMALDRIFLVSLSPFLCQLSLSLDSLLQADSGCFRYTVSSSCLIRQTQRGFYIFCLRLQFPRPQAGILWTGRRQPPLRGSPYKTSRKFRRSLDYLQQSEKPFLIPGGKAENSPLGLEGVSTPLDTLFCIWVKR